MKRISATLILDSFRWRLVLGNKDHSPADAGIWSGPDASPAADRIAKLVAEFAPKTRRIAILLDASLCLTARFQMDSARQARKREALLYKIEEHIPIAAEDLIADFVRHGSHIYAVAAERKVITPLIGRLQDHRLSTELISPISSLAWEHHFARSNHPEREAVAWLDRNGRGNLVVFIDRQPVSWVTPTSPTELWQQLKYEDICSSEELPLVVYTPQGPLDNVLPTTPLCCDADNCSEEVDPHCDHAMQTLNAIRSGHITSMFDLTRGLNGTAAGRGPLAFEIGLIQVVLVLLLASVLAANLIASLRYSKAIDGLVAAQEDIWRETFPESKLPRGVRPRLESELAKLAGARGATKNTVADESVLPLIFLCLRAMPEEMRFRLLDVKIEGRNLDMTGEVRDFADADNIAASIRREGFLVKPPTSRRLPEQGVGLRLQATYIPQAIGQETSDE